MINEKQLSINQFSRLAGIAYLVIIATGLFGQVFVRNDIIVVGDLEATIVNLKDNSELWRLGIVGDLIMHLCDIPVIVFLYWLLSQINRPLAMIALVSNVLQTAVAIANKINLIYPLLLIANPDTSTNELRLIETFINAHNYGFAIALLFFGISCIIYGHLIYRSNLVAKPFGVGIAMAGICYLINSFALLLYPPISAYVMFLLLVCLLAELAFALRLTFYGLDFNRSPYFDEHCLPHTYPSAKQKVP